MRQISLYNFLKKHRRTSGRDVKSFLFHSDQWILASPRVCFGATGASYGLFAAPIDGNLVAVKLVYQFGYVSCNANVKNYWSFWGCGEGAGMKVNTVITDSSDHTLMPPKEFENLVSGVKYYKIPGYNSMSPEIILSSFSSTPVEAGEQLRLWYGEDLQNVNERDNGGRVCCTAYAMYS